MSIIRFATRPTVIGWTAAAGVVAAVALSYAGAAPPLVLAALMIVAVAAWLQDDRQNAHAYVALLGVQIVQTAAPFAIPYRPAIADLFVLPLIARWTWRTLRRQGGGPRTALAHPMIALVAVYAAATAVAVMTVGAPPAYVWFNKDAGLLFLIAGFLALGSQIQTRRDLAEAITWFTAGGSAANAVALVLALAALLTPNPVLRANSGRLYGWLLNPSSYGSFVATVALLELGRLVVSVDAGSPRWVRRLRWCNYALLMVAAGLTVSRSVWTSIAAGAAVLLVSMAVTYRPFRYSRPAVAAVCATILVPGALLAWIAAVQWQRIATAAASPVARAESVQERLANACAANWNPGVCTGIRQDLLDAARAKRSAASRSSSAAPASPPSVNPDGAVLNARGLEDRAAILGVAWKAYTASYVSMLFGIGLGTFYVVSPAWFGIPLIIHNTAVWFLVEMGPAGLMVLIWFLARIARDVWSAAAGDGEDRDIALGLAAVLAAWLVYSIFNEAFYLRHFWFVALCIDRLRATGVGEHRELYSEAASLPSRPHLKVGLR